MLWIRPTDYLINWLIKFNVRLCLFCLFICFQYKTEQIAPDMMTTTISTEEGAAMGTTPESKMMFESVGGYKDRSNVLGLVVFSCVLGIVLGRMGPEGDPLKAFANSLMETIMRLVSLVIWYVMSLLGITNRPINAFTLHHLGFVYIIPSSIILKQQHLPEFSILLKTIRAYWSKRQVVTNWVFSEPLPTQKRISTWCHRKQSLLNIIT